MVCGWQLNLELELFWASIEPEPRVAFQLQHSVGSQAAASNGRRSAVSTAPDSDDDAFVTR